MSRQHDLQFAGMSVDRRDGRSAGVTGAKKCFIPFTGIDCFFIDVMSYMVKATSVNLFRHKTGGFPDENTCSPLPRTSVFNFVMG